MPGRVAWAKLNVPRVHDTIYAEFYLLDAPFMIVHRVKRDPDGKLRHDFGTDSIPMEPPAIVPLNALPPARLLRG